FVRQAWRALGPLRWDALQWMPLGLLIPLIYGGTNWEAERSFVTWANTLPEGTIRDGMVWLSEHLRIFPNAIESFVRQVGHNSRGAGVYILGETHPRALWYYYPLALTMKLSVPLLLLPLVALP